MYKLLVDADALIKFTHAKIIQIICSIFDVIITKEIESEVVTEGKKRLYPDAFEIETLIQKKLIIVKSPRNKKTIKESLGMGEKSLLDLARSMKSTMIISDDSAFLRCLEKQNMSYIIPSDMIIVLTKLHKIKVHEALTYLEYMKPWIKKQSYDEIKKELNGGE